MTVPAAQDAAEPLRLYAVFHLNLMFSSVEEWQRHEVVERCYWPLVELASGGLPIGIEASGLTIEWIADHEPSLLDRLRKLASEGPCELVGSGYAQVIGPLVPAAVNRANLALGQRSVAERLGVTPRLAFVNEQAWSGGLVPLYREAGFRGVIMEWNNAARAHPEWRREWRYHPQLACGPGGESIPVLWNDAIAFQRFQRLAHGTLPVERLLADLRAHVGGRGRLYPLYGNDVEIFDFRPRRYAAEPHLVDDEWRRIRELFAALDRDPAFELVPPSDALARDGGPDAGHRLVLGSADQPCPVKKQPKYNLGRWAVTGRDDLRANSACFRVARALETRCSGVEADWRELCELWGSDFRTHVTDARWRDFRTRQRALEARVGSRPSSPRARAAGSAPRVGDGRWTRDAAGLRFETPELVARFDPRRGLALTELRLPELSDRALVGTIPHGAYDDIAWAADFYTGHVVFQAPGAPKVTDLAPAEPFVDEDAGGLPAAVCTVPTELGPVEKRWTLDPAGRRLELTVRLFWPEPALGALRFGHVTLLPEAFDPATLFHRSHCGGPEPETFAVGATAFDHGAAVSGLVSASQVLGLTGGWLELGDARLAVRIDVDQGASACVGLVTHARPAGACFLRASFSAREIDDTARPVSNEGLCCRLSITARRTVGADDGTSTAETR